VEVVPLLAPSGPGFDPVEFAILASRKARNWLSLVPICRSHSDRDWYLIFIIGWLIVIVTSADLIVIFLTRFRHS
jgi:hypothetical protein